MTKFVFCFPYRGVGGVPVLFVRLAKRLVCTLGHDAYVVDYADGAMARAVAGSAVGLIVYDDDRKVMIPEEAILVFQSLNPWAMYPSLHIPDTTRIFFWNCHPFNLVPVLPGLRSVLMSKPRLGRLVLMTLLRRYRGIVVRMIGFLLARGALVFMDKTNVGNTENYLDLDLPPQRYLPVPAEDVCPFVARPRRDWQQQGLRLAWIGRLADFKYPILRKTLQLLDTVVPSLGVPVRFTVVGDGEHRSDLALDVEALKHLKVEMVGDLPLSGIGSFLAETDVLFAMGTSALDGARLAVPTILLDIAYGKVPDGYCFTWLHTRSGYTLGEVISSAHVRPGNETLVNLLRQVMDDFDSIARAIHVYYGKNHSPQAVTEEFLRVTQLSNCFYRDFERAGFSARDPVYDFFAELRKRFVSP